jgi:chromosome segregation ATPase
LQHIPGQAIISPDTTSSSVNTDEEKFKKLLQKIKNLKSEVQDLKEEYETLKAEQLKDKENVRDFGKIKLQLELLLENKSHIIQSQTSLQQELRHTNQETGVAAEDIPDLEKTMEMDTHDKELAEVK